MVEENYSDKCGVSIPRVLEAKQCLIIYYMNGGHIRDQVEYLGNNITNETFQFKKQLLKRLVCGHESESSDDDTSILTVSDASGSGNGCSGKDRNIDEEISLKAMGKFERGMEEYKYTTLRHEKRCQTFPTTSVKDMQYLKKYGEAFEGAVIRFHNIIDDITYSSHHSSQITQDVSSSRRPSRTGMLVSTTPHFNC